MVRRKARRDLIDGARGLLKVSGAPAVMRRGGLVIVAEPGAFVMYRGPKQIAQFDTLTGAIRSDVWRAEPQGDK